jgi:DNA-binding response OmpR family regulator
MAKVLLIEDETDLARVVARELESAGFVVARAADGIAGLEAMEREQPELIILDWMMPRLDGIGVLAKLRQHSAIPVLMLTARGEETDRVIGLELGADDYLMKPFSMRELVARVRALLRRSEHISSVMAADRTASGEGLQHLGIVVDPLAYRAECDSKPLELTRIEFALLHLLVKNPGRAFSRAYLIDTVWGDNYLAGDRSVDNAILRLRKKLGDYGDSIETVWGVGYRLRAEE